MPCERTVTASGGAWPFVTLCAIDDDEGRFVWRAREHRKGLSRHHVTERTVPFWQQSGYNVLIGLIFAVGAALFVTGSVMALIPAESPLAVSDKVSNWVFFAGSIPFTTAAYLQHFQAANSGPTPDQVPDDMPARSSLRLIGWAPESPGWISTLTQFVGTICFNFNTFDAIAAPRAWYLQDIEIWLPGMMGSVLFLVSAWLAFIETAHAHWAWRPSDLDWQIAAVNLLGCVAFMLASTLAYVPAEALPGFVLAISFGALGFGALCFFVGALLLVREARVDQAQARSPSREPQGDGARGDQACGDEPAATKPLTEEEERYPHREQDRGFAQCGHQSNRSGHHGPQDEPVREQ